jgi:hypothetical protein
MLTYELYRTVALTAEFVFLVALTQQDANNKVLSKRKTAILIVCAQNGVRTLNSSTADQFGGRSDIATDSYSVLISARIPPNLPESFRRFHQSFQENCQDDTSIIP